MLHKFVRVRGRRARVPMSQRGIFWWFTLPARIIDGLCNSGPPPVTTVSHRTYTRGSRRNHQINDVFPQYPIPPFQPAPIITPAPAQPTPPAFIYDAIRALTHRTIGLAKSEAEALVASAMAANPRVCRTEDLVREALRLRLTRGVRTS